MMKSEGATLKEQGWERGKGVRIDRRCPRCHAHRYHWCHLYRKDGRTKLLIGCAECGHEWFGRYRKCEWTEE